MDFSESLEQAMLRRVARSFLDDHFPVDAARRLEANGEAAELWRAAAGLGWLGCGIPEALGGSPATLLDLVVLAEELGRALFPLPVLPTLLGAAWPIIEAGDATLRHALLPAIARGDAIAVLATGTPALRAEGGGFLADGVLPFLRDVDLADWIICAGGEDAATAPLLLLDRRDPGISLRPLRVIGRDRVFDVTLRGVSVPARHVLRAPGIAARALDRVALAGCACMVGACEHILEMTVRHATDRRQFGQPIGANQAIQHLCADMAVDVTNARHLTRAAAWADAGGNAAEAIAMARLWTMAACERVCLGAHKVHGAIGLTDEHALSIHARRLLGLRQEFGEADAWADRLATGLGL